MPWNYVPIALLPGSGAWFMLRFRMNQPKVLFPSMKLLVWGEHGPLPQRPASAEPAAEARLAVRES
ncbi:hypothetical protein [Burkholderia latens]|uniref:hypothetical protein n=1 Tax=Burkholderia latens TaxID=488446 RepID=UPI001FC874DD|nr:hypothetical protein [Burkholderia latens]